MIDPTRLAAIKALKPTPGPYRKTDGGDECCIYADPEYGLQALAAEVERLQGRETELLAAIAALEGK